MTTITINANNETATIDMAEYGVSNVSGIDGKQLTAYGIELATDMDGDMAEKFENDLNEIFPFYAQIGAFSVATC